MPRLRLSGYPASHYSHRGALFHVEQPTCKECIGSYPLKGKKKMVENNEIKVAVSGSSIYKAVANYIKNDGDLQKIIKKKAENFLSSSALETALQKRLDNEFSSWRFKEELAKQMSAIAAKMVKEHLTEDKLDGAVKRVFANMLIK